MRPTVRSIAPIFFAAVIGCGGASVSGPDPVAVPAGFVRLATWNVHDLFDAEDRTAAPGDGDTVPTPAEVEAKLQAVGRVLSLIDADVAVLQEVENAALLERLSAGPLAGRGYRTFLREGHDPRGIDVGVLSRLPFEPGPTHLDERGPDGRRLWARDLVEIDLPLTPRPIVVLGAHLVSRLDAREDARRLLQATRLREVADAARGDRREPVVVILGDLNDVPGSPALVPLLGDGAYRDLGSAVPVTTAWTWSGGGVRERMDYALIAREDSALVMRVAVESGPAIAAASDHRPLVVDVWIDAPVQR
jgi:endonuclease/exonuclease/phosphatase family metal-dependent hydrolase